jgi:hypothetical protein
VNRSLSRKRHIVRIVRVIPRVPTLQSARVRFRRLFDADTGRPRLTSWTTAKDALLPVAVGQGSGPNRPGPDTARRSASGRSTLRKLTVSADGIRYPLLAALGAETGPAAVRYRQVRRPRPQHLASRLRTKARSRRPQQKPYRSSARSEQFRRRPFALESGFCCALDFVT